jgi:hypothetical protein
MPRFFTLEQAERLLPSVEASLREAVALKAGYQESDQELQNAMQRITMLGGSSVHPGPLLEHRRNRDSSARQLQETVEQIQSQGCVVKDLDLGLIDFPTLLRGQEVYLCWKLGERGITFWHGVDEGFPGRKPIDADFLSTHRGDLSH